MAKKSKSSKSVVEEAVEIPAPVRVAKPKLTAEEKQKAAKEKALEKLEKKWLTQVSKVEKVIQAASTPLPKGSKGSVKRIGAKLEDLAAEITYLEDEMADTISNI